MIAIRWKTGLSDLMPIPFEATLAESRREELDHAVLQNHEVQFFV